MQLLARSVKPNTRAHRDRNHLGLCEGVDVALAAARRHKAASMQLQRQVALLGEELRCRGRIVGEADAALAEVSARLSGLCGVVGVEVVDDASI